jgi:hypothetical protein
MIIGGPAYLQGVRVSNRRAPGRNNPKCSDCRHDLTKQHHTPKGGKSRGYRLGWCVVCKQFCPSVIEMYEDEEK